jgi:phage baseplate assembly protein W
MSSIPNYYGFNPPFFGGHQNILSKQSGQRIIKNDLQQLIMTTPGERVMRPDFGTIVKKSLFEQITPDLTARITQSIVSAIAKYESRVRVNVTVSSDPDNNLLTIRMAGYFTNQPNLEFEQELALPLPTNGG